MQEACKANANPDGGIIDKEMPINASNVKLADAKDTKKKKATKKAVKGDKK